MENASSQHELRQSGVGTTEEIKNRRQTTERLFRGTPIRGEAQIEAVLGGTAPLQAGLEFAEGRVVAQFDVL